MGTPSTTVISVKVPIKWDAMTERQKTRLSRITSRDTRVIHAYLGVIAYHEKELLVGKRNKKINGAKLEKLTLTAERSRDVSKHRTSVPHDFKKRFPNISLNELQECRQVAVAMWNSYLALEGEHPMKSKGYRPRKLPRYVYNRRFKIIYTPEKEIKHWLRLMDSLDSAKDPGHYHDYLMIPLSPSSYHLNRMNEGIVTSLRLLKDRRKKWWSVFSVRAMIPKIPERKKTPAILGIDLGIDKAVCSVVLTPSKVRHVRYLTQPEKLKRIEKLDKRVDALQHEMDTRLNNGQSADDVVLKLRELSGKRKNISIDDDRVLVKQLVTHILELSKKYDLYVAIGKLTGIRDSAGRGSGKKKSFRSKVARWTFARFSNWLKHSLAQQGWSVSGKNSRFFAVREYWTSRTCHKCGYIGLRPKQSLFICHTCGYRTNADKNGAINIARRLIRFIPSLRDEEHGLGQWLLPHERSGSILKASRNDRSKGKSSPPSKLSDSRRRSVVECQNQTSLTEFEDTTDPAIEKAAERPSATNDALKATDSHGIVMQRIEAQSGVRENIPMKASKAHVHESEAVPAFTGNSSHEKGGTWKLMVSNGGHSPHSKTKDRLVHASEDIRFDSDALDT